jgi:hypothetical protein
MFSRIALADQQIFLQLMSATAASKSVPESQLWESLLDQWWTRVRMSKVYTSPIIVTSVVSVR